MCGRIKYNTIIIVIFAIIVTVLLKFTNSKRPLLQTSFDLFISHAEISTLAISNDEQQLYMNGQLIGGVYRIDIANCDIDFPTLSAKIHNILESAGVSEANNRNFDYMVSPSVGSYLEVFYSNIDQSYIHYIYLTENTAYDLWFNKETVTDDQIDDIRNTIQVNTN